MESIILELKKGSYWKEEITARVGAELTLIFLIVSYPMWMKSVGPRGKVF